MNMRILIFAPGLVDKGDFDCKFEKIFFCEAKSIGQIKYYGFCKCFLHLELVLVLQE